MSRFEDSRSVAVITHGVHHGRRFFDADADLVAYVDAAVVAYVEGSRGGEFRRAGSYLQLLPWLTIQNKPAVLLCRLMDAEVSLR
jgi:hypothetical protein